MDTTCSSAMRGKKTEILKVVVGSQAHGLATPQSDTDYRAVYVLPTEQILSLGYKYKGTHWVEGQAEDATAYEIGHFLQLATQCNPSILEVFLSPAKYYDERGMELTSLFDCVWTPKRAFDAFTGYSVNQRKKFLDKKDNRADKYAAVCIRVLYNLTELLETRTFTIKIADTPIGETVRRFKNGDYSVGEVIQRCEDLKAQAAKEVTRAHNPNFDLERVNRFLIDVRTEYLSGPTGETR